MREKEHEKAFQSFVVFRRWSYENGYGPDMLLRRVDESLPYSRDNCEWVNPDKTVTDQVTANIAQWDRMVDRIRIIYGMEPIISANPCTGCRKAEACESRGRICQTRARYWDQRMSQIRKAIGAERR